MQVFRQMQQDETPPYKFTFVLVIRACAGLGRLEEGMSVDVQIIESGLESRVFVGNSLIAMYAKMWEH